MASDAGSTANPTKVRLSLVTDAAANPARCADPAHVGAGAADWRGVSAYRLLRPFAARGWR
nr:hypothetical protein [Bradyrhizobium canariense]